MDLQQWFPAWTPRDHRSDAFSVNFLGHGLYFNESPWSLQLDAVRRSELIGTVACISTNFPGSYSDHDVQNSDVHILIRI